MYQRHSTVTKNGKTHTYWRLVRAVRVGRKVRQETVAQLGELDAKGRIAARHLADSLVGVDRQPGLFDEELPTAPVTVVPSRLRLERGRRFGDVWFAWKLWQALGLDTWLEKRLARGREDVPRTDSGGQRWTTCSGCPRPRSMTGRSPNSGSSSVCQIEKDAGRVTAATPSPCRRPWRRPQSLTRPPP
jgi:hypothetical protein